MINRLVPRQARTEIVSAHGRSLYLSPRPVTRYQTAWEIIKRRPGISKWRVSVFGWKKETLFHSRCNAVSDELLLVSTEGHIKQNHEGWYVRAWGNLMESLWCYTASKFSNIWQVRALPTAGDTYRWTLHGGCATVRGGGAAHCCSERHDVITLCVRWVFLSCFFAGHLGYGDR